MKDQIWEFYKLSSISFQHDGATPHTARETIEKKNQKYVEFFFLAKF